MLLTEQAAANHHLPTQPGDIKSTRVCRQMKPNRPSLKITTSFPPDMAASSEAEPAQGTPTSPRTSRATYPPPGGHSSKKFSALHLSNTSSIPTPATQGRAPTVSEQFLGETMGRPDLVDFMAYLNEKIPIHDPKVTPAPFHWAFTGSVAIQIHGYALNCQIAKNRTPNDVDVITSEFALLDQELRKPDERIVEHADETSTLSFGTSFKIDVIDCENRNRRHFGNLTGSAQVINGVPVMSLDALLASKEAYLANYEATGNHPEIQTPAEINRKVEDTHGDNRPANDPANDTLAKIRADIAIIKTLQQQVIPPHLKASYENIGFPEPINFFKDLATGE